MKDAADKVTMDLAEAPGVRRQRGRPPGANTPTDAERKAASRARRLAAGVKPVTVDLAVDLIAAIEAKTAKTGQTRQVVIEKILRNQLMRAR